MSMDTHDVYCPTFKNGNCPDHCAGGNDDNPGHTLKFYELGPDIAAEKDARFVSVCDQCAEIQYLTDLPEGADTIGPTRGTA